MILPILLTVDPRWSFSDLLIVSWLGWGNGLLDGEFERAYNLMEARQGLRENLLPAITRCWMAEWV